MASFSFAFQLCPFSVRPTRHRFCPCLCRALPQTGRVPCTAGRWSPDKGVALAVGNVLALVRHIHGAENDVVMQMALVDVGGNHIGVFALQHFIGKLPPDLMGLLRRGFPRFKGLYQVVARLLPFWYA